MTGDSHTHAPPPDTPSPQTATTAVDPARRTAADLAPGDLIAVPVIRVDRQIPGVTHATVEFPWAMGQAAIVMAMDSLPLPDPRHPDTAAQLAPPTPTPPGLSAAEHADAREQAARFLATASKHARYTTTGDGWRQLLDSPHLVDHAVSAALRRQLPPAEQTQVRAAAAFLAQPAPTDAPPTPDPTPDHAAESPVGPPAEGVEASPEQWVALFLGASPGRQVEIATATIVNARRAAACFEANHTGQIEDLRRALARGPSDVTVEEACKVLHDAYEAAAVDAGWQTQQASRKPWPEVPEANKATMRAAVDALIRHLHFDLATVWAQGHAAGTSRAMRRMSDEPNVPDAVNPYLDRILSGPTAAARAVAAMTLARAFDPSAYPDQHLIEFTEHGWTIAHPLSERLALDSLFDCDLTWDGDDPGVRGRFVLTADGHLGQPVPGAAG